MFVLGYRYEDENGDESIGQDKLYSSHEKQPLLDKMKEIIDARNKQIANSKLGRKAEQKIIRRFIIDNYEVIYKKGVGHYAVFNKNETKETQDSTINFLELNPGYVQEVLGPKYYVPNYSVGNTFYGLDEDSFIIVECEHIS